MKLSTTLMATLACTEAMKLESKAEFLGDALGSVGNTFAGIGEGIGGAFGSLGNEFENLGAEFESLGNEALNWGADLTSEIENWGNEAIDWGADLGTDAAAWGADLGNDAAAWGADLGNDAAAWGADLGQGLDTWTFGALDDIGDFSLDTFGNIDNFVTGDIGGAFEGFGAFIEEDVGGAFEGFGQFIVEDVGGAFAGLGEFIEEDVVGVLEDFGEFVVEDVGSAVGEVIVEDIGGALVDMGTWMSDDDNWAAAGKTFGGGIWLHLNGEHDKANKIMGNSDAYTGDFYKRMEEMKKKREEYAANAPIRKANFDKLVKNCNDRSIILNNRDKVEKAYANYLENRLEAQKNLLAKDRKEYDIEKAQRD